MAPDSAAPARRIVIVGSGVAAWMAADALVSAVNLRDWSVQVISGQTPRHECRYESADAALPWIDVGRAAPALDEDLLVSEAGASFTFGIALSGWSAPAATWFHPFGSLGAGLGPVPFHQLLMRLRRDGPPLRLANYSLPALAAQAGRFIRPGKDPRSVLSTCRYGLHVDCNELAGVLRKSAVSSGAQARQLAPQTVELATDGSMAAVVTVDGQRIEGDLFVDCSGPERLLISALPDTGWEDWSAWLPCNRLVTARMDTLQAPPPYSHAEAHRFGWVRYLPLQGQTRISVFHSDDAPGFDPSLGFLRAAGGPEVLDVRFHSPRFGRLDSPWRANCVALGSAAALIDPLAVSNLHLLRAAVGRLLSLLPADRAARAEAREFNRLSALQLDCARDFAIAHYKLNGRHGEELWDGSRGMTVPESLDYKLRLYESRGRVAMYDEEPLDDMSWLNLLDEHGLEPRQPNPLAEGFGRADLEAHLERVRNIMIGELARMPTHGDYLKLVRQEGLARSSPDVGVVEPS